MTGLNLGSTGPVFITGAAGSGITMLQLLLHNFPGVHGSDEEVHPDAIVGQDQKRVARRPYRIGERIRLERLVESGLRVVVIIRDGRDVMVSQRRPGSDEYYVKRDDQWVGAMGRHLPAVKELPEFVCAVRYEALVMYPARELLNLGNFLGFEPPADLAAPPVTSKAGTIASAVIGGRTSVQSDLVGRWRLPKHKARIQWLLADPVNRVSVCRLLMQLGYEKDDSWAEAYSAL